MINVARYYHHETVRVGGKDDDIRSNIRVGLDITKAALPAGKLDAAAEYERGWCLAERPQQ